MIPAKPFKPIPFMFEYSGSLTAPCALCDQGGCDLRITDMLGSDQAYYCHDSCLRALCDQRGIRAPLSFVEFYGTLMAKRIQAVKDQAEAERQQGPQATNDRGRRSGEPYQTWYERTHASQSTARQETERAWQSAREAAEDVQQQAREAWKARQEQRRRPSDREAYKAWYEKEHPPRPPFPGGPEPINPFRVPPNDGPSSGELRDLLERIERDFRRKHGQE